MYSTASSAGLAHRHELLEHLEEGVREEAGARTELEDADPQPAEARGLPRDESRDRHLVEPDLDLGLERGLGIDRAVEQLVELLLREGTGFGHRFVSAKRKPRTFAPPEAKLSDPAPTSTEVTRSRGQVATAEPETSRPDAPAFATLRDDAEAVSRAGRSVERPLPGLQMHRHRALADE